MSRVVATAKPARFASAIVVDTSRGYHLLKIDGYSRTMCISTGNMVKSRPFILGGHRWYIEYFPNGDRKENADYISLFLRLDETVATPVKAQFIINFADEVVGKVPSLTSNLVGSFGSQGGRGYSKFVKRQLLERSDLLKDDSFTVRCDIVVINKIRAEDFPETVTPKFVSVPPSDLKQHLGDLLRTEKGADVVFDVGGQTFAAHRCVLASRSPVFSAELFGVMKEGDIAGVVRVDDMEAQVFKALLCFAYTDSLPATATGKNEDVMCQHLLVAADRYNMDRLKLICEEKLCKYINVTTAATILTLAEQHHCDGLKKACFNFLGSPANLRAVMATDGFDHLTRSCPSLIKELVTMLAP